MKKYFIIMIFIHFSCVNRNNSQKENNIDSLKSYIIKFQPNKINSLEDNSLHEFNLKHIFKSNEIGNIKKNKIVNILLLKQYLYHLKIANQSYNLKDFKDENSKIIIGYFLKNNKIDTNVDFLSSARPYEILKKEKNINDKEIIKLMNIIIVEENRILRETE